MDNQSPVQFIECKTAGEFLDSLSPRGKYFAGERSAGSYVFRGHGDQRYRLLPTALRLGTPILIGERWREVGCWNNKQQIEAELCTIDRFFQLADSGGLALPEDSQALRHKLFELQFVDGALINDLGFSVWPPQELLSLIALAQHYGLPTRLLDWSRDAFTAAYFAAIEAAKWQADANNTSGSPERLAVWAFKGLAYDLNRIASQGHPARLSRINKVTVVTAPASSNPNLRAQRGVFTLFQNEQVSLDAPAEREPMDCVVRTLSEQDRIYNKLIEFSLPICESPKLLRLLGREGIDAATLFPGYFGVAKALKEKRHWAPPEN